VTVPGQRALNRTLLARQHLLGRADVVEAGRRLLEVLDAGDTDVRFTQS
jgi:hypothetical protein